MGESEVLIKVATDISDAIRGLAEVTQQLSSLISSMADVSSQQEKSEQTTKSFWETFVSGATEGTAASVAWGEQISKSFDYLKEGLKDAVLALPKMVTDAAEAGDEMFTLSNRIGVSVEGLSQLKYIAGQSGASMEGMARTIQGLGAVLADTEGKSAKAIEALGLSVETLKKQEPQEAFFAILKGIQSTVPASEQVTKAMQIFGGRFRQNTMLLKEDIDGLRADSKKFGDGMTSDLARMGDTYSDTLKNIEGVQEQFRNSIASKVLPTLNEFLKKFPEMGGAALTFGETLLDVAKNVIPLLGNLALMKSAGMLGFFTDGAKAAKVLATELDTVAVAEEGVATAGATASAGLSAGFLATLGSMALKSTLLAAALYSVYAVIDGFQKNAAGVKAFGEASKDLAAAEEKLAFAQQHLIEVSRQPASRTQNSLLNEAKDLVTAAEAGLVATKKALDAAAAAGKVAVATAPPLSQFEIWAKNVKEVKAAYDALTSVQKDEIKTGLDAGASVKDIAEVLGKDVVGGATIAAGAISLFQKDLEAAKKAAEEKTPFQKLMEDAAALSTEIKNATKLGVPFDVMLETFGKKADELSKRAFVVPGAFAKIGPEIIGMGVAFDKQQLSDKMLDLVTKATELATAFRDKVTDGAKAAADAVAQMVSSMATNLLSGSEQRLARIKEDEAAAIASIQKQADALDRSLAEQLDKIQKNFDAQRKLELASLPAGQRLSQATIDAISAQQTAAENAAKSEVATTKGALTAQIVATQQFYGQKTDLENKSTKSFEKNAELRGAKTKAVYAQELKDQKDKLKFMLQNADQFNDADIKKQQELVKQLGLDDDLRTLKFKSIADEQLRIEQEKLDYMLKHQKEFTPKVIAEQRKIVADAQVEAGVYKMTWKEALSEITDSFQQMFSMAGPGFADIASGMGVAKQAGDALHTSISQMGDALKGSAKDWKSFAAAGIAGAAAIAQGIGGLMQATNSMSVGKNVLGGASAGASMGSAFGPIGSLVGGAVGAIVGLFRNRDAQRAIDEVSHDMGVKISDGLAKGIQDSSNDLFGGHGRGRSLSEVFHLGDIIKEAGGITAENFDTFTAQFGRAFDALKTGGFTVKQFGDVANTVFPQLAAQATKMGGVWTDQFKAIVTQLKAAGKEVTGLKELIDGQLTQAASGLNNVVAGFQPAAIQKATDLLAKQKDLADQLAQDQADQAKAAAAADFKGFSDADKERLIDDKKALEDVTTALNEVRGSAVDSQDEFDRLSRLSLATFNSMVKNGHSTVESIQAISPTLDTLKAGMTALGLSGNVAFDKLSRLNDLAEQNAPLLASISGLNDMLAAMANLGALDADTFNDIQAQGEATFKQLTAAGFTQQEALQQMAPLLQTINDLHKKTGLAVDENTQALLDQAKASGDVKDQQMSTNDVLMEGFAAVIKALGGDLPAAFQKFAGEASDSLGGVAKSATGVANQLGATDWTGWSQEAVDAANTAKDAVDGLTFGNSPDGIKEIPIQLAKAMQSFKEFQKTGVGAATNVKDAVDALQGVGKGIDATSVAATSDAVDIQTQAAVQASADKAKLMDVLSAMTEAMKTSQVSVSIPTSVINSDGLKQAVEVDILPRILTAIDQNNRGSQTKLKQILGSL